MTPEVQAHLFEPFFTTKSIGKGTGLGLSVVDGIVKQSGGHIAVDSAPARGTTFKIYLPAVKEPSTAPAKSAPSKPVGGSETILLAEDEQQVLATTVMVLETLGYRVLQAASGEEALRLAENCREKIHLLMTDVLRESRALSSATFGQALFWFPTLNGPRQTQMSTIALILIDTRLKNSRERALARSSARGICALAGFAHYQNEQWVFVRGIPNSPSLCSAPVAGAD